MTRLSAIIKDFFLPELKAIVSSWISMLFLLLVVCAALFSIGFSNGALEHLKRRMDNPFVKWINVNLPYSHVDANDFRKDLDSTTTQERFFINKIDLIPAWYSNFKSSSGKKHTAYLRLIEPEDELLQFIGGKPELVMESRVGLSLQESPWGCIISSAFLERLNDLDKGSNNGFINFTGLFGEQEEEIEFPIPIVMVVEQLPDNYDLMVGPELFFALRGDYNDDPFDIRSPDHEGYLSMFFSTPEGPKEFQKRLEEDGLTEYRILTNPSVNNGFLISKRLNQDMVASEIAKAKQLDEWVVRYFDPYMVYSTSSRLPELRPDQLMISLHNLDSVRALKDYMLQKHTLKIDLNTVEAKENFNVFSKFIKVLSAVLTVFSITLVIYVLSSLMQAHIEKNHKNLGTLKAFGMSNRIISLIYGGVSLVIIVGMFLAAILVVMTIGSYLSSFLADIFKLKLEGTEGVFNLKLTAWLLAGFIVAPMVILYVHVQKILSGKTPGDLIYGRG